MVSAWVHHATFIVDCQPHWISNHTSTCDLCSLRKARRRTGGLAVQFQREHRSGAGASLRLDRYGYMGDFLHPHLSDLGLASGVLSDIVITQCGTTIRVPPSLQRNTHTPHPVPFSLNSNSAFRNACLWCLSVLADRHHLSRARDRLCRQRIGPVQDLGLRDMAIIGNRNPTPKRQ